MYSFIIVHQPAIPGYRDQLPYTVGLVELDEQVGLRLPARIVGIEPADVEVGMRVTVDVEPLAGGLYSVALFRPIRFRAPPRRRFRAPPWRPCRDRR